MSAPEESWAHGDYLGLDLPAHAEALRAGGVVFLTRAFQAAGALSADNKVLRITKFEDCPGGSTGRKLFLSVAFEKPEPGLRGDLFVKFSRDFDDPIRDRVKDQLEAEVRFALLSRLPGFPIAVPKCLYADYHHASGTGILITECIPFGEDGVEPLYEKCRDYEMPAPLEHYQALIKALARLSGAHKAGRLTRDVAEKFPFDARAAAASDKIRYDAEKILNRISRYEDFAAKYPRLLPENVRSPEFIVRLREEAPRFLEHEAAIKTFLHAKPDLIALCHWNANIDNAWFWRDGHGQLQCGLMDWGRVGQMSMALALWGGLSAAEKDMWDAHLDDLLALFVSEFEAQGGPALDAEELKFHMMLFIATMALAWLFDAPALVEAQIPDLAEIEDRFDPRFNAHERARVQLHMFTNVLNLWDTQDFGQVLNCFEALSRA